MLQCRAATAKYFGRGVKRLRSSRNSTQGYDYIRLVPLAVAAGLGENREAIQTLESGILLTRILPPFVAKALNWEPRPDSRGV